MNYKSIMLCAGIAVFIPVIAWLGQPKQGQNKHVQMPTSAEELLALAHKNQASNHIIKTFVPSRPLGEVANYVETAAKNGDLHAQTLACYLYREGLGTIRNSDRGTAYCEQAADKGHDAAELNLGTMYYTGDGKPVDYDKAEEMFKKAGKRGWYSLWLMAAQGRLNISQDQAHAYLRSAAMAGEPLAQYELGRLTYQYGGNINTAIDWLEKASKNKDFRANVLLGDIYQYGEGVKPHPERAMRWYREGAENGNGVAMIKMGFIPAFEAETPAVNDLKEAIKWFEKAAQHPHERVRQEAKSRLSITYATQKLVQDDDKFHQWLLAAANDGHVESMRILSIDLYSGKSKRGSAEDGVKWAMRAAFRGDEQSSALLDQMYNGRGYQRAYQPYIQWLKDDVKRGNPHAALKLGKFYISKNGVDQSLAKSIEYLTQAADGGLVEGHQLLAGSILYQSPKNPKAVKKALNHAQIAAAQNDPKARMFLTNVHFKGKSVPKNAQTAYVWASLAQEKDRSEYLQNLKLEIKKELSEEEIAAADQITKTCQASDFQSCPALVTTI